MRLKFPDLTRIHAEFENPTKLKFRAKEISEMANRVIKKVEGPRLLGRLKDRIVECWRS